MSKKVVRIIYFLFFLMINHLSNTAELTCKTIRSNVNFCENVVANNGHKLWFFIAASLCALGFKNVFVNKNVMITQQDVNEIIKERPLTWSEFVNARFPKISPVISNVPNKILGVTCIISSLLPLYLGYLHKTAFKKN